MCDFLLDLLPYVAGPGAGLAINTLSGVGVFACGTQEAGNFAGSVRVLGRMHMGIASQTYAEDSSNTDNIVGKVVNSEVYLDQARLQEAAAAASVILSPLP